MKPDFDRRQLMALIFVSSLAPAVRLIPKFNTQTAGTASWVAPIVALPFLVLYVWFLSAFLAERHSGEGLGEMIMRTNGRALGSVVLGGMAAFLIFCCGFILRSGAERFICTIYPAGNAWPFVIVMLTLGLILSVDDSGDGIPQEELSYAFERYKHEADLTKPQGAGMGLAVVRGIAELHKGAVIIESRGENMGTSVRVMLSLDIPMGTKKMSAQRPDYDRENLRLILSEMSYCLPLECFSELMED